MVTFDASALRNVPASMNPTSREGCLLWGELDLGSFFVRAVAPSRHAGSLAWLAVGEWVNVQPTRIAAPAIRAVWSNTSARIEWIDWPAVVLKLGGSWTWKQ